MREAFFAYFGWVRYWLTPSNWYWSKANRRARQFAKDYIVEYEERYGPL